MTFLEKCQNSMRNFFAAVALALFAGVPAIAGEADLVVPSIKDASLDSYKLLIIGLVISVVGLAFGFI
jgi:hypothetical protein